MRPKKYGTIHWIWFWGIVTLMFAWLTEETQNTSIFWATIVTVGILIVGTLWTVGRCVCRKAKLHAPFDVYYEPEEDTTKDYETVSVSDEKQYLKITLRMRTEVYVEHISVQFVGSGRIPQIQCLDDWGRGGKGSDVDTHPVKDGTWYWGYNTPLRRPKKSRVKLGIEYMATGHFDGYLVVGFTAPGASKRKSLPFSVI